MQEEQPVEDFWIALFNKIDYRIGLDYHSKFLIAILQEINNLLDEKQQFSIKILDSLNPIIYTTYNINPIIDFDDQPIMNLSMQNIYMIFAYKFLYAAINKISGGVHKNPRQQRKVICRMKALRRQADISSKIIGIKIRWQNILPAADTNRAVNIFFVAKTAQCL